MGHSLLSPTAGIKTQVVLALIFMSAAEFFRWENVLMPTEPAWTGVTSTKYQF